MNRRVFLKSAFATLALPALESVASRSGTALVGPAKRGAPMRMVCIGNSFGMYPDYFFPKETGPNYGMTHLLEPLAAMRRDFSVFSHLDHAVKGGHFAVHSFLSGVKLADAKGMPEGNISVDQRAAEHVGASTRFPSLTVGSEDGLHGGCRMCWTRSGVRVPPIEGPRELFRKLFINESMAAQEEAAESFALKRSILDSVSEQTKDLERRLSQRDKEKLEEYLGSIRDVETQLELDKRWSKVSKPKPTMEEPEDRSMVEDIPVLYDLILAALETDSTRIATFEMAGADLDTSYFGLRGGYHGFSHHGKKPEKIEGLVTIEYYQMQQFARFLEKLKSMQEPDSDGSLLDNTMVLFGSGMGNGNAHVNKDLPLILAGGGFKLGEHKAFPEEQGKRIPLSNLFLSMLQRFGVETESFSKSTGTLTGLELA
ncbi:MAG: DUF1552 domain-containing protein [Verrucomicrobiota bacterium]